MLIRLRGCAGWSAPVLFADRFSSDEAHLFMHIGQDPVIIYRLKMRHEFIHIRKNLFTPWLGVAFIIEQNHTIVILIHILPVRPN